MPAGRKTKLNDEIARRIYKNITRGMTRKYAAHSAGISQQTFLNWIHKGENARSGKYFDFFNLIKKAEANLIGSYECDLKRTAKDGSVAGIVFALTNRAPSEWEDRRNVNFKGSQKIEVITHMPEHSATKPLDEQVKQAATNKN